MFELEKFVNPCISQFLIGSPTMSESKMSNFRFLTYDFVLPMNAVQLLIPTADSLGTLWC